MQKDVRVETLDEKIKRVTTEIVELSDYNPAWPELFEEEKANLLKILPKNLIVNIEHFGSTAVPNLIAKPIIDMAIEINDTEYGGIIIPKILEPQGYDCFWRPKNDNSTSEWFTWCIKRDESGKRTHHLHFVEVGGKNKEFLFRDILISNPNRAKEYGELKIHLSQKYKSDRVNYTSAKSEFIENCLKAN